MAGTCILSFDCEGKWGIADRVDPFIETHFTNERLLKSYRTILSLLEQYEVPATFAFVGAFTLSSDECRTRLDLFPEADPWFQKFRADWKAQRLDGWLIPEAFEMVLQHREHEIASHGFSHRPLCPSLCTQNQMTEELKKIRSLPSFRSARTFVYPRNLVGYTDQLAEHGFVGYRDGIGFPKGSRARLGGLLEEWNLLSNSEDVFPDSHPIRIPGRYFINWRRGLRKTVPRRVTLERAKRVIHDACQSKGVVHFWTHPHNFVTGDQMDWLFEAILKEINQKVQSGALQVLTQEQFSLKQMGHRLSIPTAQSGEL